MATRKGGTPPSGQSGPKPAGWAALESIKSVPNNRQTKEIKVSISIHNATFDEVVRLTVNQLDRELMLTGAGSIAELGITEDDMKRYLASAIYTRIQWVNGERNQLGTRPDGSRREWLLPDVFASITNAIGRVEDSNRGLTYVPQWNEESGIVPMNLAECQRMASMLKAIEGRVHLVDGFEKRPEGVEEVMSILAVEVDGGVVEFVTDVPISPVDAITAMVLGLDAEPASASDVPATQKKNWRFNTEAARPHVFGYSLIRSA